nr:MAG TPA: hypothetical protein [Caudoviricetes sp.]
MSIQKFILLVGEVSLPLSHISFLIISIRASMRFTTAVSRSMAANLLSCLLLFFCLLILFTSLSMF